MRPQRAAAGALLGLLLLWLEVATAHQLVTGRFWLWGVPNPLAPLLFFAGPPLALAAIAMLGLAGTALPRRDRALLSSALASAALVGLHIALSDRTWLWVMPDLVPPLLFLLLPLALVAALLWLAVRRAPLRPAAARASWALAALALALGVGQSGLNPGALAGGATDGPAPPDALRIVSWDTLHWDAGGPDRFYRYLREQRADVYLLQEYMPGSRLARELPGYQVAAAGDLLTLSRFPVVVRTPLETNPRLPDGTGNIPFLHGWKYGGLRTDLWIGGRTVSVYNLHLYDRFYLNAMPVTPAFLADVRGLDQGRKAQLDMVLADVERNPNPTLVSGNLNTLPNAGDLRRFAGLEDASRADRSLYPTSLRFFGPSLWRVDWMFAAHGIGVHRYALLSPQGLSSHDLQEATISVRPARRA